MGNHIQRLIICWDELEHIEYIEYEKYPHKVIVKIEAGQWIRNKQKRYPCGSKEIRTAYHFENKKEPYAIVTTWYNPRNEFFFEEHDDDADGRHEQTIFWFRDGQGNIIQCTHTRYNQDGEILSREIINY
jgi:hypothetical protein